MGSSKMIFYQTYIRFMGLWVQCQNQALFLIFLNSPLFKFLSFLRKSRKGFLSKVCVKPHGLAKVNTCARKSQQGQLVIEYVLLLTVVTVLASQIIRLMIGQGATPDEQGMVVQKWSSVINAIAADIIDN